jgi:outer membrane protein OmpA-like peptidoglycan-associated protein
MRLSASSMLAGALLLLGRATPAEACMSDWNMIFFDSGSASLDDRARATLERAVAAFIAGDGNATLRLTGTADRAGSAAANLRLSRRRAETARDFLTARGVPWSLIEIVALGETRPLVATPDGTAEPQNRSVELIEIVPPAEQAGRDALRRASGDTTVC